MRWVLFSRVTSPVPVSFCVKRECGVAPACSLRKNAARMSEYTQGLSRNYIHSACKAATKVSGDHYVMLECPFRRVTHTFCPTCNKEVPLEEVEWADSGHRISEYRREIASGVTFWEKMRLTLFGTAYEGALRLNLDAKGNPKPGTRRAPVIPELVSKSPLPEDQAAVVASMQELTGALIEVVPSHFKRIRCEIQVAPIGDRRSLAYTISNPDHPADETTEPNDRVNQAASRLVRMMNPSGGPFPGLTVTMERMNDSRWRNSVKLMETGRGGTGPDPSIRATN